MKKGTKITLIIIGCCLAAPVVVPLLLFAAILIGFAFSPEPYYEHPTLSKSDNPPAYTTTEDFYRLTGVEFPEIVPVDSLFYDEGCLRANMWNEHKFIASHKLPKSFYKRLDAACKNDPGHWTKGPGRFTDWAYRSLGMPVDTSAVTYRYWVYPSDPSGSEKVDRSKEVWEREDWDGTFVSVEIQKDTVYLLNGWLR